MRVTKVLVTGASEGIGRALAVALAGEGYSVMGVARNEDRLKNLTQELGEGHKYCVADLSQEDGIKKVIELMNQDQYTVLINNAGYGVYGHFIEKSVENHLGMMRLNCDALLTLSHAFLTRARPGDSLVNVSSTLAFLPMPTSASYAATKAFVTSLSEALWYEQKDRGVYVMNLCPGLTRTEFFKRAGGRVGKQPPEMMFETADQVAARAVQELRRQKKPTVISGTLNQVLAFLTRFLPRKVVVSAMGQVER